MLKISYNSFKNMPFNDTIIFVLFEINYLDFIRGFKNNQQYYY